MRRTLVLLMALLAAACTKGLGRAPCPAGTLCLEVGNNSDLLTIDPSKSQLVPEARVLYDLMIGLTTFNAAGETVPGMATSWQVSRDGLTWTFHLRDANWSDGVPVTADDFVFAMRRLQDPRIASPYAYLQYMIVGAEAINAGKARPETLGVRALDPHTLEMRLIHPAPYLPLLLVHSSGMPVPAHAVRKWGDAWVEPGRYVSNGPYVLKSWTLGDRLVLDRNPAFYGAHTVCFDRVSYFPVNDPVSGQRRIESGELDAIYDFPSNRLRYLNERMPGYARPHPGFILNYISFNTHLPALADRRVRLALSMGIDRDFIVGSLLRAGQKATYGFVPPGMANTLPFRPPAWAGWSFARRQAAARRLLTEAGYGPHRPLRLEMKYFKFGESILMSALQADWHTIGAEIALTPVETQVHFADLNAGNFEIAFDNWGADFNDPITFLLLLSKSGGPQNHSGYANLRYDALLAAADREPDASRRAGFLAEAERGAMADVPVAPIYVGSVRDLVNPRLNGWIDNPADIHVSRSVCPKGARPRG